MALNTEKCNAWVERDKKVFAPTQHLSYYPMVIKKVDQDVIYDEDDNQYIDFLSSASSLNLGSCNPIITAAVKEQLDNYSQYTIAYTYGRKSIEYAERLTSVYPGGVPAKIVFGNCGSDANDAAVKFARAYTGRSKIITFINAYHGSTYGSISMSMVTTRMRAKMGPMLPDIYCFPFYDVSYDDETCEKECIADIERAFATYLPAEEVAAVIIEPVQGDAGLLAGHPIFMKKLYDLCKKNGILFIGSCSFIIQSSRCEGHSGKSLIFTDPINFFLSEFGYSNIFVQKLNGLIFNRQAVHSLLQQIHLSSAGQISCCLRIVPKM